MIELICKHGVLCAAISASALFSASCAKVPLSYTMTTIVPVERGVTPKASEAKFEDLMNDDLPNGFLDDALKDATLSKPISCDPRITDPRYVMLRQSLKSYPQGTGYFVISLTWDNSDEAISILKALKYQFKEESLMELGPSTIDRSGPQEENAKRIQAQEWRRGRSFGQEGYGRMPYATPLPTKK